MNLNTFQFSRAVMLFAYDKLWSCMCEAMGSGTEKSPWRSHNQYLFERMSKGHRALTDQDEALRSIV